jgi:radical SAM superfamily enzyme YgiQ (UPF0313 family)
MVRVGIIFVFVDYHRLGGRHRGVLQPQIGPLIAALLPDDADIEIINDTWCDPAWDRHYDLLFISSVHSDFDRARQIAHYFRRRGARTVYGGNFASMYPALCQPYFDAVVIGDPESTVPRLYADFRRGQLRPLYRAEPYAGTRVPTPRVDLAADQQVLPLGLEATRGCPFSCEFCILTGVGTRFEARPAANVVRDITAGRAMLAACGRAARGNMIVFYDNNIGGNLPYLRELCTALEPLKIHWGSSATFNVLAQPALVAAMARSGCRFLYVGLESFNPATLRDMHKFHNAIHKTRAVIEHCHAHGILLMSGLMLSPLIDDLEYLESIPQRLRECGLHVPGYICFETPIPGTPHFHRLAAEGAPAFMPNALLRDFNTYTLVVRPRETTPEEFVAAYRRILQTIYAPRNRLRKLWHDVPRLLRGGGLFAALLDIIDQYHEDYRPDAGRTYIAGSDREPPEANLVPLTATDFDSEAHRRAIMEPWRVTDADGRVLPLWLGSQKLYTAGACASPTVATTAADNSFTAAGESTAAA